MDGREAIIRQLLPLVRRTAARMARLIGGSDIDDLIGDGCVGLVRAVDSYDPSRGTTLLAYARPVIMGSMLNGVRRLDPVSERARRTIRLAEREQFALANERGVLPSMLEMEERVPHLRAARVRAYRNAPISLDAPLPVGEVLGPDWSTNPERIAEHRRRRRVILRAVAALPERQRKIMAMHYFGGASLHAIGRCMSVSPQRVSQLHLGALRRLRRELRAS